MTYRDLFEADLDDPRSQDIVLAQHSTIGPWVVVGLGVVFAGFLAYLTYANLLVPAPPSPTPERSLRVLSPPDALFVPALSLRSGPSPFPGGATVTVVPQRWASDEPDPAGTPRLRPSLRVGADQANARIRLCTGGQSLWQSSRRRLLRSRRLPLSLASLNGRTPEETVRVEIAPDG